MVSACLWSANAAGTTAWGRSIHWETYLVWAEQSLQVGCVEVNPAGLMRWCSVVERMFICSSYSHCTPSSNYLTSMLKLVGLLRLLGLLELCSNSSDCSTCSACSVRLIKLGYWVDSDSVSIPPRSKSGKISHNPLLWPAAPQTIKHKSTPFTISYNQVQRSYEGGAHK